MKKLSEYVLGRLMSGGPWGGADLSGGVAAVDRHEIVDGSAEAVAHLLPKWLPADQVLSLVVV